MTVRGLIFDFDGLILDTESTEWLSWQEIYADHGCQLPLALWGSFIGRPHSAFDPYAHLEELLGRTLDRQALRALRRIRCRELNHAQPPRLGVEQYLSDARRLGLHLAVASSSDRPWVEGHLQRLGLRQYFAFLVCCEDTQAHKPDPAPYLHCLERLQLAPAQAVALEDSANGIAAAKAAGLFCLAVPNPVTAQLNLSQADLRVDSLAALPLEELLRRVHAPSDI